MTGSATSSPQSPVKVDYVQIVSDADTLEEQLSRLKRLLEEELLNQGRVALRVQLS